MSKKTNKPHMTEFWMSLACAAATVAVFYDILVDVTISPMDVALLLAIFIMSWLFWFGKFIGEW